jgi:predicted RNA binding protein YcfA (HicA-like mRNA interferase family)
MSKLPTDVKPLHPKPIPKGTLKAILNQIEISPEELKTLLK